MENENMINDNVQVEMTEVTVTEQTKNNEESGDTSMALVIIGGAAVIGAVLWEAGKRIGGAVKRKLILAKQRVPVDQGDEAE